MKKNIHRCEKCAKKNNRYSTNEEIEKLTNLAKLQAKGAEPLKTNENQTKEIDNIRRKQMKEETREKSEEKTLRHTRSVTNSKQKEKKFRQRITQYSHQKRGTKMTIKDDIRNQKKHEKCPRCSKDKTIQGA
jgi:hypothetical protein